jgi:hypothetical protein
MANTLILPTSVFKSRIEELAYSHWGLSKEQIEQSLKRKLGALADEAALRIRSNLIDVHPLTKIVEHAVLDVVDHANAVDALGPNKAFLLHVRHIEEVYTVIKYLVAQSNRYSEFAWRWENFRTIHAIRNRLFGLRIPLDPVMLKWIKSNLNQLKVVHKKFENDPEKCKSIWEKYSNWLWPISLAEIFAAAERQSSYVVAQYDWNSQSVHFSPISNMHMDLSIKHMDFAKFSTASAKTFINQLCREAMPLVAKQGALKDLYAKNVLLEIYRNLTETPEHFAELVQKYPAYCAFATAVRKPDLTKDELVNALIGELRKDPLVVSVNI